MTDEGCERKDLFRGKDGLFVWGMPLGIISFASITQSSGLISLTLMAVLFTGATAWIGIACLINARRCSRTHCLIAGYLLPFLSVAGIVNLLGVVTFSWSITGIYWDTFYLIIIGGFLAELLWKPYYRH